MSGKRALIIGCGISGKAAASFLLQKRWHVDAFDDKPEALQHSNEFLFLEKNGLQLMNVESIEKNSYDLAVISPGIPFTHPLINVLKSRGVEIVGEIELAARFVKNPCIGITGTNGKTTVTLLTAHILNSSGVPASAVGNVGTPLTSIVADLENDQGRVLVLELSSFQLESLHSKILDAAVILNITPDHLDRYFSMKEYAKSKSLIASALKSESAPCYTSEQTAAVLKADNIFCSSMKLYGFSPECAIFCDGKQIVADEKVEDILPLSYRERKNHDIENALAAYALCRAFGVTFKQFFDALATFRKPPHRLEFVRKLDGISYYDDSKGTNIDAVEKAVDAMIGKVVLIAGGVHKGASYELWAKAFAGKVKMVFAIGESAQQIKQDLGVAIPVAICSGLEQAVLLAQNAAASGENVLLAPGCSSFDQFRDYKHRGEVFQRLVHELKSEGKL